MSDKKTTVVFAPGVLESIEATVPAENMQAVLNEIQDYVNSEHFMDPEFEDQILDLDELMLTDPGLYSMLIEQIEAYDNQPKPTLQ